MLSLDELRADAESGAVDTVIACFTDMQGRLMGKRLYGDFGLRADLTTLRRIPWHEATVMVQCDVEWHDGTPVAPSPRQVLRAQVERAHSLGFEPMFGSELEFFLFRE